MDQKSDELALAIELLRSDARSKFPYERQLRMFQFQCWLLDSFKQDISFRQSAIIFAAALLSSKISRMRSRYKELSTKNCFLLAVANKNMEDVVDLCLATRTNIYSLLRIEPFPLWKQRHDEAVDQIEKLNTLVEIRLRLNVTHQPSSLNNAWETLARLAPGHRKRTTLAAVHRARQWREPFLYAAKRVAPEFLSIDFGKDVGRNKFLSAEALLSQMASPRGDVRRELANVRRRHRPH